MTFCEKCGLHKKLTIFCLWVLCAVGLALGLNLLYGALGITEMSAAYTEVKERQYAVSLQRGLVLYGIIYPFMEEFIFRFLFFHIWRPLMGVLRSGTPQSKKLRSDTSRLELLRSRASQTESLRLGTQQAKASAFAVLGILLSGLLFGLFHGNIVQGSYAFFMGTFFAAAYLSCGSLLLPVCMHAAANIAIFALMQ